MAFIMVHTGGPYGDCCSDYDVVLDHEYTIEEFIKEVLSDRANEWGTFYVSTDLKNIFVACLDKCEYKYGKIIKDLTKQDTCKMKTVHIKANGGYTSMNYYIKPLN